MESSQQDSIELSLLGVDPNTAPSLESFPKKFNRVEGLVVWNSILQSQAFARRNLPTTKSIDLWLWCIRTYLYLCKNRLIFPFRTSTSQSSTDSVFRYLVRARLKLAEYFARIQLFKRVTVLSTERSYRFTDKSFQVTTKAHLAPIHDPTFVRWLTKAWPGPMFTHTGQGGVFRRQFLGTEIEVILELDLKFPARPVLNMRISCPSPVGISHTGKMLTGQQMTRYVENYIWLPLVRTYRIKDTNNRPL